MGTSQCASQRKADKACGTWDMRALAGSTLLWSWVGALYMSAFFAPFGVTGALPEIATWAVSLLGVPVCLVMLWRGMAARRLVLRRGFLVADGCLGVAASLLLVGSAQSENVLLLGAGSLLGALFMAFAIVAWGAVYCREGVHTVTLYVAGGLACALVPNVVFNLLIPPLSAYAFALLPLASMALLATLDEDMRSYASTARVPAPDDVRRGALLGAPRRLFGVPGTTLCGLALVLFGIGYMEHAISFSAEPGLAFAGNGTAVQIAHGTMAALLLVCMLLWRRRASWLYRASLLAIVAGFSLMPFLYGTGTFWLCGAVIIVGYVAFDLLIWIMVAQTAHDGRADAFRNVCVMRLAMNGTFCALGGLAGMAFSRFGAPQIFPCADAVFVGYLMTVAVMLVLGSRSVWDLFEEPAAGTAVPAPSVSEQMQRLAAEWGLTVRERDVFELLAVGRTQPWVAEHLGISENTVGSHVRRIYAKSGVNSRQELLDLVFPAQSRDAREEVA